MSNSLQQQSQNLSTSGNTSGWILGLNLNPEWQEIISSQRSKVAETAPLIRAEFGDWLSDCDVLNVYRAQRENSICAKCDGAPCKKNVHQYHLQVIEPSEKFQMVYVSDKPCKYIVALWRENALKKMFVGAEIPEQYKDLTFDDYKVDAKNKNAVTAAHKLIDDVKQGVYFYGNYGCGKTMLAAIIAQEHLKKGYSVVFGDVPSLLDDIKSTFDKGSTVDDGYGYKKSAYEMIMDEIENADVLILDDIGAEKATDWATEKIYSIVNNRYNAQKAVIVTSNYDGEGLIKHAEDLAEVWFQNRKR